MSERNSLTQDLTHKRPIFTPAHSAGYDLAAQNDVPSSIVEKRKLIMKRSKPSSNLERDLEGKEWSFTLKKLVKPEENPDKFEEKEETSAEKGSIKKNEEKKKEKKSGGGFGRFFGCSKGSPVKEPGKAPQPKK